MGNAKKKAKKKGKKKAKKKAKKKTDLEKALKVVSENRVKKLNPDDENLAYHYVVTGFRDDYLVILPEFCTCEQFILRCLKKPGSICYHILAARMTGDVKPIILDNWIDLLLREH